MGDTPEVCDRLMIPQLLTVTILIQFSDKVIGVLGCKIQCNLGKVQVCSDTAGTDGSDRILHVLHDLLGQFLCWKAIHLQVGGYVQEGFINGVNVDILWCKVF